MTTDIQAIDLPFDEAIAFFRQKANVKTKRWTDVWKEAHSRAFMVAGAATDALVQDFRDAVDKAIAQGTTLEEFRKDFDRIVEKHGWKHFGSAGWRARVIYETNLAGAYAAGRYAQMADPDVKSAYPYWQYVHGDSRRPRPQHLAWNGLVLPCDDGFWDTHYPPNGWRCSCYVRPCSRGDLSRMGKDGPDDAPPIETRTWIDKASGRHERVPVGIDPGFDYNPGKAWLEAPVKSEPMKPQDPGSVPKPFNPIDARDLRAADAALAKRQGPWAEGLSGDEAEQLAAYKGALGRPMNQVLRGGMHNPALERRAAVLSGALARAEAPADMVLYRAIGLAEAALYRGLQRGDVVPAAAFLSASLGHGVAAKMALAEQGVVIEILARRGQKGVAYVNPFPTYRYSQYEALLNAGTRLRVLQADAAMIRLEVEGD